MRRQHRAINLLVELRFGIAWETVAIDPIEAIIEVTSIMKLISIARRGIQSHQQVVRDASFTG